MFIEKALANTDQRIAQGKPITPAFLFAVLLWYPLQQEIKSYTSDDLPPAVKLEQGMKSILRQQIVIINIPKYFIQVIYDIWRLQSPLSKRRGKSIYTALNHSRFRAAYDFLILRSQVGEVPKTLPAWWSDFQKADDDQQQIMVKSLTHTGRQQRRKTKRK